MLMNTGSPNWRMELTKLETAVIWAISLTMGWTFLILGSLVYSLVFTFINLFCCVYAISGKYNDRR